MAFSRGAARVFWLLSVAVITPPRQSPEPALSAPMGLRPTKVNENPGCPISRAFFAREVGIFDRAESKGRQRYVGSQYSVEVYFYWRSRLGRGMSVFHGRFEFPVLHGFDSFFRRRPIPRLLSTRMLLGRPSVPTIKPRVQTPWYFALRASSENSGSGA